MVSCPFNLVFGAFEPLLWYFLIQTEPIHFTINTKAKAHFQSSIDYV